MNIRLHKLDKPNYKKLKISGSKSETNRAILLIALKHPLEIENGSNSDDSIHMLRAITNDAVIDVGHAGTAMRFLTAYFAIKENSTVILKGSGRMHERPISVLVDALRQLGAEIHYLEKEGYPPLKITGKKIVKREVSLQATISSQYISALLLIGSRLENGIRLKLIGKTTSTPYIQMTLEMLNRIGSKTDWNEDVITVSPPSESHLTKLLIESDWSSASYYYSIIALSPVGSKVEIANYQQESLQGDSALKAIYEQFGVKTNFKKTTILLEKIHTPLQKYIALNLIQSPDIAQTIAVTCLGLGISCHLKGLHTLKIKETDRLQALKDEIEKFGANVIITADSLQLNPGKTIENTTDYISIETYQDHRMAMAFAPLALKTTLQIKDSEVVSKSYPDFWKDLELIGFEIQQL